MAKTKISEFDVNPDNNTDINNINIAEGCAPSGINNAIRQLMSDLKEFQTGAGGDPFNGAVNGTVGATTPNTGAFTTLSASGAFSANGGATLGDASGDALTINSSAVSIPNGLNFDSNTFVIDATNNRVGVGTASPSTRLHVASAGTTAIQVQNTASSGSAFLQSTNTATSCYFGVDATGGYIETAGAYATVFYTNSAERMRIDSSGNVGIGTSSPSSYAKLAVVSPDNNGYTNVVTALSNNLGQSTSLTFAGLRAGSGSGIGFYVNGSTSSAVNIDTSGNLLVGTTNAQTGSVCFAFDGAVKYGLILDNTSTIGSGQFVQRFRQNGAFVGSIQTTSSATFYVTSSDYRLKENIAPMTGALAKVQALKPVTYTWKSTGEASQGFIAHELQAVVPDCVTGEKDAVDAEGNPEYQGIDTSFLVATLTAAIQEQQAIITDLKARIETLENK